MYGVNTILIDMPCGLKGCTFENCDGSYTVLINAKLPSEQQRKTYLHELKHIFNNDFEKEDVDVIERRLRWL